MDHNGPNPHQSAKYAQAHQYPQANGTGFYASERPQQVYGAEHNQNGGIQASPQVIRSQSSQPPQDDSFEGRLRKLILQSNTSATLPSSHVTMPAVGAVHDERRGGAIPTSSYPPPFSPPRGPAVTPYHFQPGPSIGVYPSGMTVVPFPTPSGSAMTVAPFPTPSEGQLSPMLPYPGAQPLPSGQYLVPGYAQVLPEQHDTRKVQPPATNLQGDTNSAPTPGQYQKGDRYQRHSSSRPRQRYQNTPRRLEPGHDNQNESSLQPPRELRLGLIDDGFPPLGAGKLKPWEDNFTRVSGQSNSRETGIRQPQSSDKLPFGYRPNYNPISPHQAPSAPRHRGPRNFPHRNFPHSGAQQQPYQPSEKELSIISEVIAEQVAIATPPDDELLYKKKLHERLQRLCKNVSPTAELKAFGSLVSGFATVGSDLDLVLVDSISPTSQPYFEVPLLLEQELKDNGLVAQLLAKTRVPILKIVQPPADEFPYEVAADIGFANPLAIHNTDMLYTYSKCDPRVVDMVRFVKRWAKQRKINNPYLGTLSSYGYVLMILHYLINVVQPPVLPNLQLYPIPPGTPQSEIITEEGHNIWYYKDRETLEKQAAEGSLTSNTMDLTTLLLGFFEFYAYKFGWVRDIISIRTEGGLITKMDKGWVTAAVRIGKMETEYKDRYLFAIEDPFETNHNVSRTCNFYGVRKIREEFKRANRILRMREGEMALRNKLFQEAPEEIRHHRGDGQEKLAHDAVDEQEPLSEPNEAEPDLLV